VGVLAHQFASLAERQTVGEYTYPT